MACTVQDVLETFHLRSILEAEAAGLAAERITEEGIAALLKNCNEEVEISERAHEDGFYERANELNMQFHQVIARASGNRRLGDLTTRMMEDMRRMPAFDLRFVEPRQHDEIIEALEHRACQSSAAASRERTPDDSELRRPGPSKSTWLIMESLHRSRVTLLSDPCLFFPIPRHCIDYRTEYVFRFRIVSIAAV